GGIDGAQDQGAGRCCRQGDNHARHDACHADGRVMRITLVPVHMVDQIWPRLADGFDRSVKRTGGDMTMHDCWVTARSGCGFLFVAHDDAEIHGASLWRGETWQTGAKFRCLALYGRRMKDWIADM